MTFIVSCIIKGRAGLRAIACMTFHKLFEAGPYKGHCQTEVLMDRMPFLTPAFLFFQLLFGTGRSFSLIGQTRRSVTGKNWADVNKADKKSIISTKISAAKQVSL